MAASTSTMDAVAGVLSPTQEGILESFIGGEPVRWHGYERGNRETIYAVRGAWVCPRVFETALRPLVDGELVFYGRHNGTTGAFITDKGMAALHASGSAVAQNAQRTERIMSTIKQVEAEDPAARRGLLLSSVAWGILEALHGTGEKIGIYTEVSPPEFEVRGMLVSVAAWNVTMQRLLTDGLVAQEDQSAHFYITDKGIAALQGRSA